MALVGGIPCFGQPSHQPSREREHDGMEFPFLQRDRGEIAASHDSERPVGLLRVLDRLARLPGKESWSWEAEGCLSRTRMHIRILPDSDLVPWALADGTFMRFVMTICLAPTT